MTHPADPVNPAGPDLAARQASWTRYWSAGALHSCPGSFGGNYDGAIAEFWQKSFAALAPGQQVLDIASGNGALPRLLLGLDGAADTGSVIDAIDLATMAPNWLAALTPALRTRLHLHSGVPAEQLPFADARFDLVISQYGIEYADLDRALKEAARVLAPNGRLRLLMHHAQSLPVVKGASEVAQGDTLLAADGLFAQAARMLPWIALALTPSGRSQLAGNAQANADRAAFNRCQQQLELDIAAAGAHADLLLEAREQVQQLFALVQAQGPAAALAMHAGLLQAYSEHLLRARELVVHALDAERMGAVLRQLGDLGFSVVNARPLHYAEHLMGWALSADRN